MSVRKIKTPSGKEVWVAQFRYKSFEGLKEKKKQGFKTKKEALQFERDFLDKVTLSSDMLFSTLVTKYFEDAALKLKSTTIENKKYLVETKILP